MKRRQYPSGRPVLLGAALSLTLALGCGGDADVPSVEELRSMTEDEIAERAREIRDLSEVDACALLTAAEIEAATGVAPGPPEDVSQVQGQLPMCMWNAADGSGRTAVTLLVTRGPYGGYEEFIETSRTQAADLGMEFDEADWQEVPGVGDFGVWVEEAGGMLQVYQGGLMVQVDPDPAAGVDELEAAKELAERALERLG